MAKSPLPVHDPVVENLWFWWWEIVRDAWLIVHGRYQSWTTSVVMLRRVRACMTRERERPVSPGSPAERKPRPCGLTRSVSFKHFIGCVKHLSLWRLWRCGRRGGGGGGQVNWQVSSPEAAVVLPSISSETPTIHLQTVGCGGGLVWLTLMTGQTKLPTRPPWHFGIIWNCYYRNYFISYILW